MTPDVERRMLASVDTPLIPGDAFASDLLDRLLDHIFDDTYSSNDLVYRHRLEEPTMIASMPSIVVPLPGMQGKMRQEPAWSQPRRFERKLPVIAVAAILCIMLASASAVSIWTGNDPEPVRIIPAAVVDVDDIPANNAAVETLFAATIGADQIPLDLLLDWNKSLISYMEMEPGVSYNTDHPSFFCCQGIAVLTIIDGELSLDNTGPTLIYRTEADPNDPESVDAGTPITAVAGDTVVHRMGVPIEITNSGAITTTYLAGYVYNLANPEPPGACCNPEGYAKAEVTWAQTFTPLVSTEGPVTVSWERITFEPGEDLVVDTSESQVLLSAMKDGTLRMKAIEPDGTISDSFSFSTPLRGPRAMSLDGFAGAQFAFVNESDEPAVLYLFRFNPPEDGSS